jgi:hypothetical protein
MTGCENILAVTACWFISVCMDFEYVLLEADSFRFGVFRADGTFEPTTEMLSRDSRTNPLTWEVM